MDKMSFLSKIDEGGKNRDAPRHLALRKAIALVPTFFLVKELTLFVYCPPQHLPYVFDRFYRADPVRTHGEGGHSGLELAIVNWIVKAHGGSMTIESQVGHRSTFTVLLPVYAVGEEP